MNKTLKNINKQIDINNQLIKKIKHSAKQFKYL